MTANYSAAQKLALAATVIGPILCLIGLGLPYWLVADPGTAGTVTFHMGLFQYCDKLKLLVVEKTGCEMFKISDDSSDFNIIRSCALMCFLISGICGLVALFLACCRCCDRIICLGITTFIAGSFGIAAAALFVNKWDELILFQKFLEVDWIKYGWAFYMFAVGSAVILVSSFVSCFASPNLPFRGIIFSRHASPTPYHQLNDTNASVTVITTSTGYIQ